MGVSRRVQQRRRLERSGNRGWARGRGQSWGAQRAGSTGGLRGGLAAQFGGIEVGMRWAGQERAQGGRNGAKGQKLVGGSLGQSRGHRRIGGSMGAAAASPRRLQGRPEPGERRATKCRPGGHTWGTVCLDAVLKKFGKTDGEPSKYTRPRLRRLNWDCEEIRCSAAVRAPQQTERGMRRLFPVSCVLFIQTSAWRAAGPTTPAPWRSWRVPQRKHPLAVASSRAQRLRPNPSRPATGSTSDNWRRCSARSGGRRALAACAGQCECRLCG